MNCAGDIGGLYGALYPILQLIVMLFSSKLFSFNLLTTVMRVKKSNNLQQFDQEFDSISNKKFSKNEFYEINKLSKPQNVRFSSSKSWDYILFPDCIRNKKSRFSRLLDQSNS